jgi:hypothetical protein
VLLRLTPERLASLLQILADRQGTKPDAVDRRLVSLQREVADTEERLRRLYRSIEDGIVELDDVLRERAATLKSERERTKVAFERARAQCGTLATIDSARIDAFARLMTKKLDDGDRATSAQSLMPSRSTTRTSGLLAPKTFCRRCVYRKPRFGCSGDEVRQGSDLK